MKLKTMRAAVLEAPQKLTVKELPIPDINERSVLFRVTYATVCGSDLSVYREGRFVSGFPIIPGHEFCGVVVKKGAKVDGLEIGDRFMGCNIEWCGECSACKAGNVGACQNISKNLFGLGRDGIFAEYGVIRNVIPGVTVFKIPDHVNDIEAALCEPMCVGVGNLAVVKPNPGDKVVIYGAGMIGQSFLQAAKLIPDVQVAVVDINNFRLDLARQSGADIIINSLEEGPAVEKLMDVWGVGPYSYHYEGRMGGNADIAIDCSGNMDCVAECFKVVRVKGKICLAAGYGDTSTAPINPSYIYFKAPEIFAGRNGSFIHSVENMIAGKFKVMHLVTHVFPLEETDRAMRTAMGSETDNYCKVAIKVDSTAPDYDYNRQK